MTSKRRTLLFLVAEDWYFCSHRLPLGIAAKQAGYEVIVATRENRHGDLIRSHGLTLAPIELSRHGTNPFADLAFIAGLRNLLRREKPDIIHNVAVKPVIYGTLAARLAGVPGIVNALGGLGFLFSSRSAKARVLRPLIKLAFRFTLGSRNSRTILQNPDDLTLLTEATGLDDGNIDLIRGAGVDLAIFKAAPEPEGMPVVMLPSRLLWDKGIAEFAEAARMLRSDGMHARFVLVGKPDAENPRSVPESQLQQWQTDGIVEWWGHSDNMAATLAKSHIVCLPSFYGEGIPKSLIEAAACGRPIVTTDWPGCREVVRDGQNGYLVPIKDAPALAKALAPLIEDAALRRDFGRRSRVMAEAEFAVEQVVKATLDIYENLLQRV